ncbi:MAG: MerR family transcriptional regulator [Bacteroidales bacterium]|jgi:DNA-binding transcriptional MerR regulator|nr:MerR family transcriptional regulator [Bacteroidales bacterium]MCI2122483.1 MerR family transcriptional regulator [Bacteroidales bacterium]MCI2146251.1 MerR family transcriptional regulator [Bacteroidales bacterium]
MPVKEYNDVKIYYRISEVAGLLGESESLVRYWSNEFPQYVRPDRNKRGVRLFTPKDVENLKRIHYLVKERGMTLSGAAKRMKDNREGTDRSVEIIGRLKEVRALLEEVQKNI